MRLFNGITLFALFAAILGEQACTSKSASCRNFHDTAQLIQDVLHARSDVLGMDQEAAEEVRAALENLLPGASKQSQLKAMLKDISKAGLPTRGVKVDFARAAELLEPVRGMGEHELQDVANKMSAGFNEPGLAPDVLQGASLLQRVGPEQTAELPSGWQMEFAEELLDARHKMQVLKIQERLTEITPRLRAALQDPELFAPLISVADEAERRGDRNVTTLLGELTATAQESLPYVAPKINQLLAGTWIADAGRRANRSLLQESAAEEEAAGRDLYGQLYARSWMHGGIKIDQPDKVGPQGEATVGLRKFFKNTPMEPSIDVVCKLGFQYRTRSQLVFGIKLQADFKISQEGFVYKQFAVTLQFRKDKPIASGMEQTPDIKLYGWLTGSAGPGVEFVPFEGPLHFAECIPFVVDWKPKAPLSVAFNLLGRYGLSLKKSSFVMPGVWQEIHKLDAFIKWRYHPKPMQEFPMLMIRFFARPVKGLW